MTIFAWMQAIFFLFATPAAEDAQIEKTSYRVGTYSYRRAYPEPYVCPHGYVWGPGYNYRRGWRFYAPGYFGPYRYGCYDNGGRPYRRPYPYRDRYYPGPYYYRR